MNLRVPASPFCRLLAVAASACCLSLCVWAQAFYPTGPMMVPRSGHFAVRLETGQVLIGGGFRPGAIVGDAELYNPHHHDFVDVSSMSTARINAAAILLPNGEVLVVGGTDLVGHAFRSAELYDPTTRSFNPTGNMDVPRARPALVKTWRGDVLVLGDNANCTAPPCTETVQRYNPHHGTFTTLGSLLISRSNPSVTALASGKVLVVGGYVTQSPATSATISAEVFDPATGISQFTSGPPVGDEDGPPAVRLLSGPEVRQVLLAGNPHHSAPAIFAETYDPATNSFTAVAAELHVPRVNLTATWLSTGEVLLAGGDTAGTAELYNPATRTFSDLIPMLTPRSGHTATLLDNGDVLIVGGAAAGAPDAEIFVPSGCGP